MNIKNIRMLFLLAVLGAMVIFTGTARAEEAPDKKPAAPQTRWEHYNQYARWSFGANIGIPFFAGDFQSNAYDKLYWGVMADLQGGYQFTPVVGMRVNFGYAQGKTGAKHYEQNYWLDRYGWGDYRVNPLNGSMPYKDLYSKVRVINFSLLADINLNNLIRPVPVGERRWTVTVSPGIYFQKFYPDVFTKQGDRHFAVEHYNPLTVSLGGEAVLRWKAGKAIDLQARYGINWIHQNVFDGVATYRPDNNQNLMMHFSIGVVWKIGARHKKKDALMYAPRYYAPPKADPAPQGRIIDTVIVKCEPQIVVETKEVIVEKKVLGYVPSVHFVRGSAELDTRKYDDRLEMMLGALREADDAEFSIYGYADHTGTERRNTELTQQRAEALRNYLIEHGIAPERIRTVQGLGIDRSLSGEEALSLKARRAEIIKE